MKNKKQKPIFAIVLLLFIASSFRLALPAGAHDANLKAGPYGPNISVGLREYSRTYLKEHSFTISANKKFNVKDRDGKIISAVAANTDFKIRYDGDKYFQIYKSDPKIKIYKQITFDATDGNNNNLVFDINLSDYSYDHYRGKIRLRYAEIEDEDDKIWVINILPLEQYTWGMGEMTGTGPMEHSKAMTTIFRTYGYWKIKYSTKWTYLGFKVNTTAGDQIYKGYEWEKDHPNIRKAAQATEGRILMYKDDIALAAYCSWNDGRTRSLQSYPECRSIKDPHGKHPWMTTKQLFAAGNHMIGLTANGSLDLAKNHDWGWGKILKYYYTGVKIYQAYK